MSSVSSVGTNTVDLYQLLQQTSGQTQPAPSLASATAAPDSQDAQAAGAAQGGHHHHRHLRSQIEGAVTQALQSSNSSTDPNQIIQSAIASVLSANQPGSATDPTGTQAATGQVDANGSTPAANQSAFTQLLQSYGIDSQQFQKDFQAAVQSSQSNNGNVDFSQLFKSFPPGSNIDTTA